mmetsp:Transcript_74562/g.180233  ORF Transcript_74562/g.180233 Transcript_74562/m.180233 type:complete len:212 (+) Transcript_74562:106-741(+)
MSVRKVETSEKCVDSRSVDLAKQPMSTRDMEETPTELSASSRATPRSWPLRRRSLIARRLVARPFELADRSPGWRASLRADREGGGRTCVTGRCERAGAKRGRARHAERHVGSRRPAEHGSGSAGRTKGRRLRRARTECGAKGWRRGGGGSSGRRRGSGGQPGRAFGRAERFGPQQLCDSAARWSTACTRGREDRGRQHGAGRGGGGGRRG